MATMLADVMGSFGRMRPVLPSPSLVAILASHPFAVITSARARA
jgi:hypothetical protein